MSTDQISEIYKTAMVWLVPLGLKLDAGVDHDAAIRILRERVAKVLNVKTDPAPVIEIQEFTRFGPLIRKTFGAAGFPAPEQSA
jgi:small-conductance mechanosensitive channel